MNDRHAIQCRPSERFEVMSVDLPFRLTFKHAAAARTASSSIFIRCTTASGAVGYGESLPREYVTGESQAGHARAYCATSCCPG